MGLPNMLTGCYWISKTLYSIKQKHISGNISLLRMPGINLKNYSMKRAALFRHIGMVQLKQNKRSRKRQRQPYDAFQLTMNWKTVSVSSPEGLRCNGYYLP